MHLCFLETLVWLARLRTPQDPIAGHTDNGSALADGCGMSCGTVGAIGDIRAAATFTMEWFDPRRHRSLRHTYSSELLPVMT